MNHHKAEAMANQVPALIPSRELGARLAEHAHAARGAFSPNTERALRSDVALFTAWCDAVDRSALPATSATVAAFVDAQAELGKRPATVRRYCASIAAFHRAAGLEAPTAADAVKLALKRHGKAAGTRQRQAPALNRPALERMLGALGERLIELRDAALLAVAYDSMARTAELVALDVADLELGDAGNSALIRRSKSDQEGAGSVRFLGRDTADRLRRWLTNANITSGPVFVAVRRSGATGARLGAAEVARIYQRAAVRAGLDVRPTGHSTRVGAAQDQVGAGCELGAIMQAGGWRTPTMPARYAERLNAQRSAAARLAAVQGRV